MSRKEPTARGRVGAQGQLDPRMGLLWGHSEGAEGDALVQTEQGPSSPAKRGECPGPGRSWDPGTPGTCQGDMEARGWPWGGGDHGADSARARRIKIKFIAVLSYKKITPNKQPETHQLQNQSPNPVLWEQACEDTPFSAKREVAVRAGGWLCRRGSLRDPGAHCTVFFAGHGGSRGLAELAGMGRSPWRRWRCGMGRPGGFGTGWEGTKTEPGWRQTCPGISLGALPSSFQLVLGMGTRWMLCSMPLPRSGGKVLVGSREGAADVGLHMAASPAGVHQDLLSHRGQVGAHSQHRLAPAGCP